MTRKFDDCGFATTAEFREGLTVCEAGRPIPASGVPLECEEDRYYVDSGDAHTFIFGNTGTKKSRNFIIPEIYLLAEAEESMVINDPKGEIYDKTSGYLRLKDYRIQVFNLRDMTRGSRWNPLYLPYWYYINGQPDYAVTLVFDIAETIKTKVRSSKDPYWDECAAKLFVGLVLLVFEHATDYRQVTLDNVIRLRMGIGGDSITSKSAEAFWKVLEQLPDDSRAKMHLTQLEAVKGAEKTLGCILSSFDIMVAVFMMNHQLTDILNASDIEFTSLGTEKAAIYLITPDEKSTFDFLVTCFLKQSYEHLVMEAQRHVNRKLPRRVNYIIDEFSNLPKLKDIGRMISAGRSRNIRFTLVVQSKSQLENTYEEEAETIKSNCRNWIILPCRELSLLNEVSELCGTRYIESRGYRPVIGIHDLQKLSVGHTESQALIMRSGCLPYISRIRDYETYPQSDFGMLPMKKLGHTEVIRFTIEDCKAVMELRRAAMRDGNQPKDPFDAGMEQLPDNEFGGIEMCGGRAYYLNFGDAIGFKGCRCTILQNTGGNESHEIIKVAELEARILFKLRNVSYLPKGDFLEYGKNSSLSFEVVLKIMPNDRSEYAPSLAVLKYVILNPENDIEEVLIGHSTDELLKRKTGRIRTGCISLVSIRHKRLNEEYDVKADYYVDELKLLPVRKDDKSLKTA